MWHHPRSFLWVGILEHFHGLVHYNNFMGQCKAYLYWLVQQYISMGSYTRILLLVTILKYSMGQYVRKFLCVTILDHFYGLVQLIISMDQYSGTILWVSVEHISWVSILEHFYGLGSQNTSLDQYTITFLWISILEYFMYYK